MSATYFSNSKYTTLGDILYSLGQQPCYYFWTSEVIIEYKHSSSVTL